MTKVLLGAPIRDRAWILPRFIEHVKSLDTEGVELETLFIANDCSDSTVELLREANFNVREVNNLETKTTGSVRGQYGFEHLANLRNQLVEYFLNTDNEYLFSLDTDILVPKNSIKDLIKNNKDICSMIICNQQRIGKRAHNIMYYDESKGSYVHILDWEDSKVIPVDLTGAGYLIHRSVLEAGVRYSYSSQGEDIPFCNQAQKLGFKIFCDTSIKPTHVMYEGVELIAGHNE